MERTVQALNFYLFLELLLVIITGLNTRTLTHTKLISSGCYSLFSHFLFLKNLHYKQPSRILLQSTYLKSHN